MMSLEEGYTRYTMQVPGALAALLYSGYTILYSLVALGGISSTRVGSQSVPEMGV